MSQQFLQTSLEALLMRATNINNFCLDYTSLEAFATLVNRERDGSYVATKVIAAHLPSENEREVLLTLNVLESCMIKCGSAFRSEVGKFRFLNEMIKLVSPKYLGSKTTAAVKNKILQLLYLWTVDYPKEIKIKEAFDMLRKQGVVKDIANLNTYQEIGVIEKKKQIAAVGSVFHDEEKSNILRKLLQSKDPEDIQAANWLIKSYDEKVTQLKSKYACELQGVQNNIKLLNEMLDSYLNSDTTSSELDLMKELYDNCLRFRPNLEKLEWQVEQLLKPEILDNVMRTTEELTETINKYESLLKSNDVAGAACSLLELNLAHSAVAHMESSNLNSALTVDYLSDIFSSSNISEASDILQPVALANSHTVDSNTKDLLKSDKNSCLKDLDVLGEHLLKENLQSSNFRHQGKIPMNLLDKSTGNSLNSAKDTSKTPDVSLGLDLRCFIERKPEVSRVKIEPAKGITPDYSKDDCLVDIGEDSLNIAKLDEEDNTDKKNDIKLNDLHLKLEDIRPSSVKPVMLLDDKNGITVTLYLARDKPKEGVLVFVMTAINKNELGLSNYLFQAVVPKGFKIKIQQPSADSLPPFNPFLPPSAITHVIFLANVKSEQPSLKFMISYMMDGETITEMGEVDHLPNES